MPRLAFTTFAIMHEPYGNPVVAGFEALTPAVFTKSEEAPGFISRAVELDDHTDQSNFERDWGDWGPFAVPRYYDGGFQLHTDTRAGTLSLWESVESVGKFVYSGLHQRALDQRKKWFREPKWPTYAMWWVADDHIPNWQEASDRIEMLADKGPTPDSFDFKSAFDASGNPISVRPKSSSEPA